MMEYWSVGLRPATLPARLPTIRLDGAIAMGCWNNRAVK